MCVPSSTCQVLRCPSGKLQLNVCAIIYLPDIKVPIRQTAAESGVQQLMHRQHRHQHQHTPILHLSPSVSIRLHLSPSVVTLQVAALCSPYSCICVCTCVYPLPFTLILTHIHTDLATLRRTIQPTYNLVTALRAHAQASQEALGAMPGQPAHISPFSQVRMCMRGGGWSCVGGVSQYGV